MSDGQSLTGQGQQGQSQQSANAGQGQQGAQGQQGQGSSAPEYVTRADFDSLASRLEDVLSDNKRYRDERRQTRQGGNATNSNRGDSNSGNDGPDLASELATMKSKLRASEFRTAITTAATRAGFIDPESAYRFFDIDDVADDDGKVGNPDKLFSDLKKGKPSLFAGAKPPEGGANGGSGNGDNANTAPQDMNAIFRNAVRGRRG